MRITQIPDGEPVGKDFEIKLNGIPAEAYEARVSAMPFNSVWPMHQRQLDQTETASFLTFSMDSAVNIELTPAKKFNEVIVRPVLEGIKPLAEGQKLSFVIEKPGQYTVELDGPHNALHIFANPEVDFGVSQGDENVIYFPAGVHHPGVIKLKSNQTLYIDRDAVVYGAVLAINAENIKILGNGILDGSWEERNNDSLLVPSDFSRRNTEMDKFNPIINSEQAGSLEIGTSILQNTEDFEKFLDKWNMLYSCVHLYGCKNVEINGVILRDSPGFTLIVANCDNTICDNIKLIGMWRYNSDGADVFNSSNLTIKNSFFRNFDDCVVLKGIPGWDTQNMENVLVENCVLWCDWGAALEIGAETNADEYKNIVFRDCDCIHNTNAALRIQSCDRAFVHDVLYENIRVEYSKHDMAPAMQKNDDSKYDEKHGEAILILAYFGGDVFYSNARVKGQIRNIEYKNISVITDDERDLPRIIFYGYSPENTVENIKISGLTMNGLKISGANIIEDNEYTEKVYLL